MTKYFSSTKWTRIGTSWVNPWMIINLFSLQKLTYNFPNMLWNLIIIFCLKCNTLCLTVNLFCGTAGSSALKNLTSFSPKTGLFSLLKTLIDQILMTAFGSSVPALVHITSGWTTTEILWTKMIQVKQNNPLFLCF